jgi:NAD+ kinase
MKRAIVVAKRSGWRRLVEDARDAHVIGLLAANDPSVARMRGAHDDHLRTVAEVDAALTGAGLSVERLDGPDVAFDDEGIDVVITVGGDGTLLAASHNVGRAPILGVNSAPGYSVGFFCGVRAGHVVGALARLAAGDLPRVTLTRMEVTKNERLVSRRVLNDALVCHVSPAATSRYLLEYGGVSEDQRSSGFWVGPAAGSTAAQRSAGGQVLPLDSEELQLVVREPYNPEGSPLSMPRLVVPAGRTVRVRSKMMEARAYLDGPNESEPIVLGDVLDFRRSPEPLTVLGLDAARRRFIA